MKQAPNPRSHLLIIEPFDLTAMIMSYRSVDFPGAFSFLSQRLVEMKDDKGTPRMIETG